MELFKDSPKSKSTISVDLEGCLLRPTPPVIHRVDFVFD
jgi:hypothetical protein